MNPLLLTQTSTSCMQLPLKSSFCSPKQTVMLESFNPTSSGKRKRQDSLTKEEIIMCNTTLVSDTGSDFNTTLLPFKKLSVPLCSYYNRVKRLHSENEDKRCICTNTLLCTCWYDCWSISDMKSGTMILHRKNKDLMFCKGLLHGFNRLRQNLSYEEMKEFTKRTLYIEYWSRTEECKERKWDHLDMLDSTYDSRESYIYETILKDNQAVLERNMFPYDTPKDIEHWTLWSREDLSLEQVEMLVYICLLCNEGPLESVVSWNYDENPTRSIDIYHVHIFFQKLENKICKEKIYP